MKTMRTGGPLGRAFGFTLDCGRLHFAFNAGWYAVAIVWRGAGFIQVSCDPWQVDWYRSSTDDGGYWPKQA